jgi:DNA polymerase-3 subunit alpha
VGPGRGSGAGSIIAYALGITKLDPLHYGLLFERFLHNERISVPDFDLDFCCKRRGEVIDYVTQKYGRDHVCQIVTFGTMAAKAAIKDMARVFDVPYAEVDKITKPIPTVGQGVKPPLLPYIFGLKELKKPAKDAPEDEQEKYKKEKKKSDELRTPELCDLYNSDETVKKIVNMALKVEGFPRNCSMHAAGVIICKRIVGEVCPLAKNGDDITSQYDMVEIEQLGMLKMDFLGLITTTDIDGAIKDIKRQLGKDIDFYNMEYDDPNVYKMIAAGDTDAVFQLESGGMKRFMKDLRPDCIADIIAGVALFRPGPMDMIPNYCRNKHNPKLTTYEHPLLENILKETYGQIVYQEQVMEIFRVLGGYSLGQADMVRRAMGKKKVSEMEKQKKIFVNGDPKMKIAGAVANGVPKDVALNIFAKMEKFAGYAFNKSHAACYAFLSYQTAYLKYYYYPFFMASMLNNRINKWEDMTHYITGMRARDAVILPPDINKSESLFTVEDSGSDVRFGLSAIKNVGEGLVDEIIKEREAKGKFKDFIDFCKRVPAEVLNKRCLESLILAGCFDCFKVYRSQLMGYYPQAVKLISGEKRAEESGQMSLFAMDDAGLASSVDIPLPKVPEFDDFNKLRFEREYVGLYLSGHPLQQYAHLFDGYNFNTSLMPKKNDGEEDDAEEDEYSDSEIKDNTPVQLGAIITDIKKIYTRANHDEMAILTCEDLFGACEVMLFPKKWEAAKGNIGKDIVVKISGKLSLRDGQNPIILGDSCEPITLPKNIEIRPDGSNKKLYLRFNLQDEYTKSEVMNILSAYSGELNVVIKDTSSGGTFDPNIKVRECRAIGYELNNLIGESNIVFK